VNVRKGEGKKPEYLKLQPFGLIPVLEDGDLTLYGESRPINHPPLVVVARKPCLLITAAF
jgi:hypothetical protein